MAELTALGDPVGNLYPVRIPTLLEVANIREALELFYYGNNVSGPTLTVGQEADIPSQSIAGRLRDLYNTKLDKNNGTTTGKLTTAATAAGTAGLNLPHGTAPSSPVNGDLWTTTGGLYSRINGTTVQWAAVNATSFTSLISIDSRTDSHTVQLGYGDVASGNTKTVNIGTSSASARGSTTVNIGAQYGATRAVNVYGTTTVNGSLSATSTFVGSSTIQANTGFIVGSSGPTLKSGTGIPSASDPNGSVFLSTNSVYNSTLYIRASGVWNAIRTGTWFTGTAAPGTVAGQQPGDLFLDRTTGKVYQYS